jgi:hypothetical protein
MTLTQAILGVLGSSLVLLLLGRRWEGQMRSSRTMVHQAAMLALFAALKVNRYPKSTTGRRG